MRTLLKIGVRSPQPTVSTSDAATAISRLSKAILDKYARRANQPYFTPEAAEWIKSILDAVLTHGYVFRELAVDLSVNTIRCKIYQGISFLTTTNSNYEDILGKVHITKVNTHPQGWRIAARPTAAIESRQWKADLLSFLQSPTHDTFERQGLRLTRQDAKWIESTVGARGVTVVDDNRIFVKLCNQLLPSSTSLPENY